MQFVKAANFTIASGRSIDLLVIHDMESPEKLSTAEDVARYFQNPSVKASAHYNIDANSVVQCVRDKDVAWAAPGANHDGLQFEHAGYARQTTDQWLDEYGRKMLFEQSAPLFAKKCKEHRIPPVFLRAPDLVSQKRGITTHWQVTLAFSRGQGHTDPGNNFPIQRFMIEIQKSYGAAPPTTKPPGQKKPMPTLRRGMSGHNVKIAQRLLNYEEKRAWDDIDVDGVFGSRTEVEVKEFQRRAGLNVDGMVGKMTWQALWTARYGSG
jgi:hypothetical protein